MRANARGALQAQITPPGFPQAGMIRKLAFKSYPEPIMVRYLRHTPAIVLASASFLLTACQDSSSPAELPTRQSEVEVADIAWFEGTVEQAFAEAQTQQRPVYLYWGAVWCPPCQEIKNTVFKSKQFIAQTEQFIPVYLDGDTQQAQTWGETFGVKGYPTMIVFNPAGDEITRIPGGIDIDRYNRVLALSLDHMRPTAMLVELALNDPNQLQASDYQQLAYYSWGQDHKALPEGSSPELFHQLAARVRDADPEASARLYLQGLVLQSESSLLESSTQDDGTQAGPEQLHQILETPELVLACWDYLAYWPEEIDRVLNLEGDARSALHSNWQDAVLSAMHHPTLSVAEQLGGWFPYLTFYLEDDEDGEKALPETVIEAIRTDAKSADDQTRNAHARQSVVNMIRYLYSSAKLNDDARQLLLAELERSASPYYFMSSLASLSESEGKTEEALKWRRMAYEASTGTATRFQWGVNYVRALIRLQPDDHASITTTSVALFEELGNGGEEVFLGRNFRYLSGLNEQLRTWEVEQGAPMGQALLHAFDARLESLCAQQEPASIGDDHCSQLLTERVGDS
ncbi:MAG: thioredoxin fold domain-containing protein [Gemmatimonadetes bacterium]|nr:thioredoxin fold domain-containing protein [Gemmatimonadota bacterium]